MQLRKSNERAFFDHGWLQTYHTFSFGMFYDPRYMGFCSLRVLNEDRVLPNKGFGAHSHSNMEIITYVIEGELAHKDSTGAVNTLGANGLQLMHAGTGITHSEFNPSPDRPVHFLQIWLVPDKENVEPGYQEIYPKLLPNSWTLVASKDGQNGSLKMHQDAKVFLATIEPGATLEAPIEQHGWLQIIQGSLMLDEMPLEHGDGVAIENPSRIALTAKTASKVMLFLLS